MALGNSSLHFQPLRKLWIVSLQVYNHLVHFRVHKNPTWRNKEICLLNRWHPENKSICYQSWKRIWLKWWVLNKGYVELSRSIMECRREAEPPPKEFPLVRMFLSLASLCMVSRVNVPYSPWFDEDSRALKIWIAIIPKSNSIQFSSRPLQGNKTGISYFN